jgi:hypothetical protein
MNIFPVGHSLYMLCYERLRRVVGFLVYLCEAHYCAQDTLKISFAVQAFFFLNTEKNLHIDEAYFVDRGPQEMK